MIPGIDASIEKIMFKNHMDKHRCMQDLVYVYESDLTGIRNRSFD